MTTLYKPLSLIVSVLGGVVAGSVFRQVWKVLSHNEEPPTARSNDYGWREVLLAATVQGAVFGLVKATLDRASARGFQKLTGVWPEK